MTVSAPLERPFIAGVRHAAHSNDTFESVNPANGEVLAEVVECDERDVDDAVESALTAQREWGAWAPARRGEAMLRWADLIVEQGRELAELDTRDMGKALRDGLGDAPGGARMIRYWAGFTDKILGEQIPATPGHLSYTIREPVGVCAVIMPWNGPVAGFTSRVSPALACGNSVVVKPSEWSPLSANRLAELALDAGMPPGTVNVVSGGGATGASVASHPKVGAISFTGSVPTGRQIAHAAADTFKQLVLEMGGKSPNIVFADADLDAALRGSVWGIFYNAGQVCVAGTRLLLHRSIADEFTDRLVALADRIRVGDPMDTTNHVGPLVCEQQYERVEGYVALAREEGAQLRAGGGRPNGTHPDGYFVAPTVFAGVRPEMRIAREEIFGPVLSVMTFADDAEALELANDVEYGLSATIWTRDLGRMLQIADQIEAGTVWGNTMRLHDPALPFGGFKASGLGNAYASGAIDGATRLKRVSIRFDDAARAPGWDDLDEEM